MPDQQTSGPGTSAGCFQDQNGDRLMLLSLGRDGVRHAAMVTILKPGSSSYGAASDQVPEICRRMYEAAALPWPPTPPTEDDPHG